MRAQEGKAMETIMALIRGNLYPVWQILEGFCKR